MFDRPHRVHRRLAVFGDEVVLLAETDAVFAGRRAAEFDGAFDDFSRDFLAPSDVLGVVGVDAFYRQGSLNTMAVISKAVEGLFAVVAAYLYTSTDA